MIIRALDPHTVAALLPGLAAMMVKTVAGCASIGFVAGFDHAGALAWWRGRLAAAAGAHDIGTRHDQRFGGGAAL